MLMRYFLSTLLLMLITCSSSFAHQQKEAYISLLFNQNSGNLEVSHRFLLHDAEHGLAKIIAGAGDLASDETTQELFFYYIQNHFQVRRANQEAIKLTPLGFEVEGKYFWIYQEAPIPQTNSLELKHSALHELWPAQTNHINIEKDGWVKSVRIQKRDNHQWQTIALSKDEN